MMDFVESMVELLQSYSGFDNDKQTMDRIEKKYPGFKERCDEYWKDIEGFRKEPDEEVRDWILVKLLKEGFVIDGIFEQDRVDCMLKFWQRANERRKTFMAEDIGLTRKEE